MSNAPQEGTAPEPSERDETSPGFEAPGTVEYEFTSSLELDEAACELVRSGKLRVSLITSTNAPSMRIDGLCPRCKHPYSQTQGLQMLTSTVRGAPTSGPSSSSVPEYFADFLCDCDKTHLNVPARVHGCGASYTVAAQ